MNATNAVNDSGFPMVAVNTPNGRILVEFLGNQETDSYYDRHKVTVTGPTAHVSTAGDGAALDTLKVHGIEYRASARVGFSQTYDRKAERDTNGDYPRVMGWHYLAGNYATVYRAGTLSRPTDKASSAIHDLILDAVADAVAQEPDVCTRAENHRRAFEAARERKRAADLRTQAAEADFRAAEIERTAGEAPDTLAALVVKS